MPPLKIIIVAHHFYPRTGGVAHATTELVKAIDRMNVDVDYSIIAMERLCKGTPELDLKKGRVWRVHQIKGIPHTLSILFYEIALFKKLLTLIAKEKPDILLFETMERAVCMFLVTCVKRLRNRIAVRIHGCTETEYYVWGRSIQHRIRAAVIRRVVPSLNLVLATSNYYLEFFREHFLQGDELSRTKYTFAVIPNVVSFPEVGIDGSAVLQKYELFRDNFMISLGRLDGEGLQQKGFEDIIAAFRICILRGISFPQGFKMVLIGDGSYRLKTENIIQKAGLTSHILLIPALPHEHVRFLQQNAAAVLLVSRFEGQAMFALESLAAASPLIISDCGGLQGIVEEGKNGFVVPRQDWAALGTAIRHMVYASPEVRDQMREVSRELFNSRFSPEKSISTLIEYLRTFSEIKI